MKKSITFTVLALFLTLYNSIAQSKNLSLSEKIKDLNSRPLKVVLKKGKSKSTVKFNENFKEAILSEWKVTDDIEFISEDDYKKNKKDKNTTNAYLKVFKDNERNAFGSNAGNYALGNSLYYFAFDVKKVNMSVPFDFNSKDAKAKYFVEIQRLNRQVFSEISGKAINTYSLYKKENKKALKQFIEEKAIKAKETLNTKTLLIDRNLINKKLDSKIKTYYPYEYKIVTREEINEAIVSSDDSKVILEKNSIIDADTGETHLMFFFDKSELSKTVIAPFGIGVLGNKIKEENLKNLGSYFK